jgi:hypothetical protein
MKRMRSERPVWGDARALSHLLRASPEQPDWCHENSPRPAPLARSAFAGFCFPPEVIVLSVRW